jgi:hypothetical protein
MKKGEKKRQQKALVRRTKRREAQKIARSAVASAPLFLIRQAHRYPIEGCWIQKDWQDSGLAVVVLARRQPDGLLVFGNYLVDYYTV